MRLGLEADHQGDVHKGYLGLLEQLPGALDPPFQQIFVWPHADRRLELGGKMHPASTGDLGHLLERDFCTQIMVDMSQYTPEAPFLQ